MPHLKINTQVPLEGNFVDQADLRFAGITTVITVSFFFCVLWQDIKKKQKTEQVSQKSTNILQQNNSAILKICHFFCHSSNILNPPKSEDQTFGLQLILDQHFFPTVWHETFWRRLDKTHESY